MNFRTIAQLNEHIVSSLSMVPRDIDIVVGVPRSGMLAATILALHLNKPLTDVEGLLAGRLMQSGKSREKYVRTRAVCDAKRILVIDDSCLSGNQMRNVRDRILAATVEARVIFAAVYVVPEARDCVDLFFDVCPSPRIFEWNLMHSSALQSACLDIDGVLCVDPTDEENDDGERYRCFLNEAAPLWIPTVPVGWLVTSRLEKYRPETERWLLEHGVRFGELVMLNGITAEERRRTGCHSSFKGLTYRSTQSQLFIESDPGQAKRIAQVAAKPVLCVADRNVYFPSSSIVAKDLAKRGPGIAWRVLSSARKFLYRRSRWH